MKKINLLVISLLVALMGLAGCGSNKTGTNAQEESSDAQWSLVQEKDEFGDEIEKDYTRIAIPIEGIFNDSETTDGKLSGNVYVTSNLMDELCDYYMVGFCLTENGEKKIAYHEDDQPVLKVKVDGETKEYKLAGVESENDLVLGLYDGSFENISYYPCYTAGTAFANHLYEGKDIKCVIEINDSTYNFTVNSSNFADASKDINFSIPSRNETIKNTLAMMREMIGENFCHRVWYNYYKDKYDEEGTLLTDEQIEEKINGDFIFVSTAKEFQDSSGKSSAEQIMTMGAISLDFYNYNDGECTYLAHPYTEENYQEHYVIYGINGGDFPDDITYIKGLGDVKNAYTISNGKMIINETGEYHTFKEVSDGIYLDCSSYNGETDFMIKYEGDYTVEAVREYLTKLMDTIE